jgi:hypothetical protein
VRLLHIDFLERSRNAASIQTAPPRAVALPPRILACSTTYMHSRTAYWKLTSIPPACYFPPIEQVLVSNLRWNVSNIPTKNAGFSWRSQFLGVFLTALLNTNPAYLPFLRIASRLMKSLAVCDCFCQILKQSVYFHKTPLHSSVNKNHLYAIISNFTQLIRRKILI